MSNKQTAMQIMLSELKLKQVIYEQSGMYESATALVTSIETAKELLAMEKEQIIGAYGYGYWRGNNDDDFEPEEYYENPYFNPNNEFYGKDN